MRITTIGAAALLAVTVPGCENPVKPSREPIVASIAGELHVTMLDLGTLGGNFSTAVDINQLGQIVGTATNVAEARRAFLWQGSMVSLGTLPGGNFSTAAGINEVGQIAGTSTVVGGTSCNGLGIVEPGCRAFFWDGTMHDLGTLGGDFSFANAITENGHVVGYSTIASGERHAFLWDGTTMHDLGTLGGDMSIANAANERGRVVGTSRTSTGEFHAFVWNEGRGMRDLGTLGGTTSQALALNARGEVTGFANTTLDADGSAHAFFWDGFTMKDIHDAGGDDSRGVAINRWGDVVGSANSRPGGIGDPHPFIWNASSGMRLLGTLGGTDGHAHAINRLTQVVGQAGVDGQSCTAPGGCNAFFWDGVMHDLGHLGAFGPGGQGLSVAVDLNTRGQIVGQSLTASRDSRAVLWTVKY